MAVLRKWEAVVPFYLFYKVSVAGNVARELSVRRLSADGKLPDSLTDKKRKTVKNTPLPESHCDDIQQRGICAYPYYIISLGFCQFTTAPLVRVSVTASIRATRWQ